MINQFSATIRLIYVMPLIAIMLITSVADLSAQQTFSINNNEIEGEAIPRVMLSSAIDHIVNEDGNLALLFTDTYLVMQLTNEGIDEITSKIRSNDEDSDEPKSFFSNLLLSALSTSIYTLLDHGIAVPLSDITQASYEDGTLYIHTMNDALIFENSTINDKDFMSDFKEKDAKRFAKSLNEFIK
jgi:hypothetical protein